MPRESNLELKVGLFVILAFIGLSAFIFSVSDMSFINQGKIVKVIFGFANGVKKSAPVRVAGVEEGIVKDIILFFDREDGRTKVEIGLWLDKDVKIPKDSLVMVNQLGLMGEKYIEIKPGMDNKNFLKNGDKIIGKEPIALESISERVLEISINLEETINGINRIINNEKNYNSLSLTLGNLSLVTSGLNEIVTDVKEGRGTIGKLFYDDTLYKDLEGLTADIKENPWKLLHKPKDKKKK